MCKVQEKLNQLKTKSILYIEDEDNIRDDLSTTLQMMCKEVYPFSNAFEALECFYKRKPDIILSDISLGDTNGLELAQTIRTKDKKVPIILLSAHTDTNYLLQAAKLKLVEYLPKPITYKELENSLFLALDEIQSNEERFVNLSDSIRYDVLHKILYENEIQKKLSSSETRLLDFLVVNRHRTLSTEEIKNFVWDDAYYATDLAFKSLMHKLRAKVGKESIKNVSGIGYYIVTI